MLDAVSAPLGDHLQPISDLLSQLSHLLTDPSPGSLTARKDELLAQRDQFRAIYQEAEEQVAVLTGVTGILEQLVNTLTAQLGGAAVTKVEISGQLPEVLAELQGRSDLAPAGAPVYGVLLLASTPNGAQALQTLLGLGAQLQDLPALAPLFPGTTP